VGNISKIKAGAYCEESVTLCLMELSNILRSNWKN
jgi:hypothetical protein